MMNCTNEVACSGVVAEMRERCLAVDGAARPSQTVTCETSWYVGLVIPGTEGL